MTRWGDYPFFCEAASLLYLRTDPVSSGGSVLVKDLVLLPEALKSEYEVFYACYFQFILFFISI